MVIFFFSSRRRHTRFDCDWSSDVCSSDLHILIQYKGADRADATVTRTKEQARTYIEDIKKRLNQGGNFTEIDRKSTRLNSSHSQISYAVFCLKKKKHKEYQPLSYTIAQPS